MSNRKRLERLTLAMTPTQVAVLLLEEMHQSPSLLAYVQTLLGKPATQYPLSRAAWQACEAVRVASKGQAQDWRERVERQAWKDAAFLMHVHHQANCKALEKEDEYRVRFSWLLDGLRALLQLRHANDEQRRLWRDTCAGWPYLLDEVTAAAVQAALVHQVQPWAELAENDVLNEWVLDACLREGKTALPFGAFLVQAAGTPPSFPGLKVPTLDELRPLFADEGVWTRFLDGTDYTNGLADTPDADFIAGARAVEQAMRRLVTDGAIQGSGLVRLPAVPMPFLQDVPLVDGMWADRLVLELAEYGVLLATRGYAIGEANDDHLFASPPVLDAEGAPAPTAVLTALRAKAATNLGRFRGRVQTINGRPFLCFSDYATWRGRLLKGKLPEPELGLVVASWNAWVAAYASDGEAQLASVPVQHLYVYGEDAAFTIADSAVAAAQQQSRGRVIAALHTPATPTSEYTRRAEEWQERATWYLADLYSQQIVFDTLSRRYFDGHAVLFPDEHERLRLLVTSSEELAGVFNDAIAKSLDAALPEGETPYHVDPAAVKVSRGPQVQVLLDFLVDFARSKTLEDMGEEQTAHALMERHLAR